MHPAKGVGQNAMPFDRDTDVVVSSIVLDGHRSPLKGRFMRSEPPVRRDAAYRQSTLAPVL